jgi:hypothetical protein
MHRMLRVERHAGARVLAALAVSAAGLGCGGQAPSQRLGAARGQARAPAPLTEAERLAQSADEDWAERSNPASLARAIESWKEALALEPERAEWRVALAHAHHLLGEGALVLDWAPASAALEAFAQGRAQAERALGVEAEPDAPIPVKAPEAEDAQTARALYWWARNLQAEAKLRGHIDEVLARDAVAAAMRRCRKRIPDYDHRGADRTLAQLYADPPTQAIRDLARAREHFEQALAEGNAFLGTRVARAETLAWVAQDRAMFDADLRAVLDTPVDVHDTLAAENALARKRAVELLQRANELFE